MAIGAVAGARPACRHAGLCHGGGQPAGLATALAFALLLGAPPPAVAQVNDAGDYLARMDADGDGRVSLSEYQAWMGYAFSRMDRDGDGVLAAHELPGGRGKPVSLAAHRAALAAAFARQDRNGDGQLDAAELAAPPR